MVEGADWTCRGYCTAYIRSRRGKRLRLIGHVEELIGHASVRLPQAFIRLARVMGVIGRTRVC